MIKYFQNLIQLIISPEKGWEDLARDGAADLLPSDSNNTPLATSCSKAKSVSDRNYERVMYRFKKCYLPAIGICACSHFVRLFYSDNLDVLDALQRAIVTFVSLFLSAEFAKYAFQIYLPKLTTSGTINRARALEMIMFCLTFMGLITLIENVVKVNIALLDFLPLYAIFMICKGEKYMNIAEQNIGQFVVLASLSILGSGYVISFLLNALI